MNFKKYDRALSLKTDSPPSFDRNDSVDRLEIALHIVMQLSISRIHVIDQCICRQDAGKSQGLKTQCFEQVCRANGEVLRNIIGLCEGKQRFFCKRSRTEKIAEKNLNEIRQFLTFPPNNAKFEICMGS